MGSFNVLIRCIDIVQKNKLTLTPAIGACTTAAKMESLDHLYSKDTIDSKLLDSSLQLQHRPRGHTSPLEHCF